MLITEMHIALDQELDSINVNLEDNLLPDQKDFFINREIQHFVKSRVPKTQINGGMGFDDIIKRLADLETLVESSVPIEVYVEDGDAVGTVSPNLYYPIGFLAGVNCSGSSITGTVFLTSASINFPINDDLWDDFSIEINRGSVEVLFAMSDFPPYDNGMSDPNQNYVVKDLIMSTINENTNNNITVYWEYFEGNYKQNTFFFVDTLNTATTVAFRYKAGADDEVENFTATSKVQYVPSTKVDTVQGRLYSVETIYTFLGSSFNTTLSTSPLATISKRSLRIYTKEKFIVASASLIYLREPQIVSLSLNKNCDLPTIVHDEVIKLTAKSIKAIIDSNNYNKVLTETSLIS